MKKLIILLFLLSSQAFSQSGQYICDVRNYRVDIELRQDTSTHFWLRDAMYRDTLAHGYAKFIEKKGDKTNYYFYPANASPVKMTFNTADTQVFPQKLKARIETTARGFLLWENMVCTKYR